MQSHWEKFWSNLEAIYREDIAKINEEKAMGEDVEIAMNMLKV